MKNKSMCKNKGMIELWKIEYGTVSHVKSKEKRRLLGTEPT
jgi:hypothetical protein